MLSHRWFIFLGIGGVVALVVAMSVAGLNENLTYYLYPTEAVDQREDFPDGETFRLAGMVVQDSVTERSDGSINFDVTDGGATIPVLLKNTPPPLFAEGVPVLVEGFWLGDTFVASEALIRHDENYDIPEEGGAHPEG